MKKLLVLIAISLIGFNVLGQKIDTLDASMFQPKGEQHRVDSDTSNWHLYKIENGKYHYFQLITYGLEYENGFSYAMGYIQKDFKEERYLALGSFVTDTIPTPENIVMYDDKKKMFKYWTEYKVGGWLGILIRSSKPYYKKD